MSNTQPRAKRRFVGTLIGVIALSIPLMAAACDPQGRSPVTIRYQQLGACNGISVPTGGGVFAGASAAYMVYGAIVVDNTGEKPADFTFEPERLFIQGEVNSSVDIDLGVLQAWSVGPVRHRLVRAGTTEVFTGVAVAVLFGLPDIADPSSVADDDRHNLLYNNDEGAQGTFTVNMNPSGVSSHFPGRPNCRDIPSAP